MPFRTPTCFAGPVCPKSRLSFKKDVHYITQAEADELVEKLIAFRMARYRYRTEAATDPQHLGFIIDDVEPSVVVLPDGETVDLYAYTTLAVLALKQHDARIRELEKDVEELRKQLAELKGRR